MENEIGISTWLLQQSPVIIVMGIVVWWLQKRYISKDEQLEKLATDFVQLSTKWHDWLEKGLTANKEDCREILEKLDEIKHIIESNK